MTSLCHGLFADSPVHHGRRRRASRGVAQQRPSVVSRQGGCDDARTFLYRDIRISASMTRSIVVGLAQGGKFASQTLDPRSDHHKEFVEGSSTVAGEGNVDTTPIV